MKGILMRPEMNLAIREDRKTVTRRCDQLQAINQNYPDRWVFKEILSDGRFWFQHPQTEPSESIKESAPYNYYIKPRYKIGETVYVKEAYCNGCPDDHICYKLGRENQPASDFCDNWESPLFMPARFARTFIQITDVRPERLQEITREDVDAEGTRVWLEHNPEFLDYSPFSAQECCAYMWNEINPAYPYKLNPWVFRYEFKRVERPEVEDIPKRKI